MTENNHGVARMRFSGIVLPTSVIAVAAIIALTAGPASPERTRAVGFAAGVCLVGALAAWLVTLRPATSAAGRTAASLAALSLRLFPALAALGWLQAAGGGLRTADADRYLVGFYLAMLAAEVIRAIMEGRRGLRSGGDREAI